METLEDYILINKTFLLSLHLHYSNTAMTILLQIFPFFFLVLAFLLEVGA